MGISGRIARFFLTSQLTPLIALVAVLLGLFAVLVTPREEEPQINVTMANVFIPFPGASARDHEPIAERRSLDGRVANVLDAHRLVVKAREVIEQALDRGE
mgnify:CR=1 FL=1